MPEISENRLIEIEIRLDIEQAVDRLPEEIKETAIFFFFQSIYYPAYVRKHCSAHPNLHRFGIYSLRLLYKEHGMFQGT